MIPILHIAAGLAVTVLLGFLAKPLSKYAKKSMPLPAPSAELEPRWKEFTMGDGGGALLGWLERFMFFCAFLMGAHVAIGAWLAFKVAAKWNTWSNVISVPTAIEKVDPVDFLIARRRWGSRLLMTFLIGTAYNIIVGMLGAAATHSVSNLRFP